MPRLRSQPALLPLVAAAACASLAAAGPASAPAVAYHEDFANGTGSPRPLAAVGWSYHLGNEGHDQADNAATASLVSPEAGSGGEGGGESEPGFLSNTLGPAAPGGDPWWNGFTHYLTEEVAIDLSSTPLADASVDAQLSQADAVRFTARVDGRWFATAEAFRPAAAARGRAFASAATRHTLDVAGRAWVPLSFLPGTTMGLDTAAPPVALPAGTLDAAGLLLQPTGHESFDDFTLRVTSLPAEPG
ncbi:hypothetical protein [Phycisphaera mikurensis]|uniref:Uncharacterized protein n=1 Tax=Phycisphaera mikurensis (strain NBRC 102666 / KCTC 22515 / FYK2301M01) TaxID=1142394 RepID=I0ID16_PHYMF|nr:hypothetical protein [Phycisphaera mikurensis]MBB6442279.1 hypothetical protein [Phycisphaera mikurensis]BAM03154.1 hypothetical protein PSMK_09950 [Phycisphaera mikurensis NBRC 102666]